MFILRSPSFQFISTAFPILNQDLTSEYWWIRSHNSHLNLAVVVDAQGQLIKKVFPRCI